MVTRFELSAPGGWSANTRAVCSSAFLTFSLAPSKIRDDQSWPPWIRKCSGLQLISLIRPGTRDIDGRPVRRSMRRRGRRGEKTQSFYFHTHPVHAHIRVHACVYNTHTTMAAAARVRLGYCATLACPLFSPARAPLRTARHRERGQWLRAGARALTMSCSRPVASSYSNDILLLLPYTYILRAVL